MPYDKSMDGVPSGCGRSGKTEYQNPPWLRFTKTASGSNSPSGPNGLVLQENAYTMSILKEASPPYAYKRCYGSSSQAIDWYSTNARYGCGLSNSWLPTMTIGTVSDIEMVNKLFSKYKQSPLNLGVTVADGKETLKNLAESASRARYALKDLKKGNLSGCIDNLVSALITPKHRQIARDRRFKSNDVAGAWLALRYGWTPLLNDIYAANELRYSYYLKNKSLTVSKKLSGSMTGTAYAKLSDVEYVQFHRWEAFLDSSTLLPSFGTRLGLDDPMSIAWEALPFSFIADWFYPVGNWLEALQAVKVIPVATVTKTIFTKKKFRAKPERASLDYYSGDFSYEKIDLIRSTNRPLPTGYSLLQQVPKGVSVSPKANLLHSIDAAALLGKAFKSF